MHSCVYLGLTFAKVTDVLWELQICAAQGRREQAHRLLEWRVEAGDVIKHGVSQQLCRGHPGGQVHRHCGRNSQTSTNTKCAFKL